MEAETQTGWCCPEGASTCLAKLAVNMNGYNCRAESSNQSTRVLSGRRVAPVTVLVNRGCGRQTLGTGSLFAA